MSQNQKLDRTILLMNILSLVMAIFLVQLLFFGELSKENLPIIGCVIFIPACLFVYIIAVIFRGPVR